MIAKYSERDDRNVLYVDCTECTRGRNGDDANKCGCGCRVWVGGRAGCFNGKLLPHLTVIDKK